MTRKNLLMMAVLTAMTVGGSAWAAEQAGDAAKAAKDAPKHARLDANGDGYVDRDEADKFPRLAQKFDELDKDKDGKLSRDELPRRGWGHGGPDGMRGGGFFARLDTDHDGRISREEAKADPRFAARFEQMDVNKDGFVDKADFEQLAKQRKAEIFAKADTDHDGKLSLEEFQAIRPQGPFGMHGPHGGRRGPADGGTSPPAPANSGN